MKKSITLLAIILSFLYSFAQENWNAVKVFKLDTDEFIYNFYIDTVGETDGEPMIYFQTLYSNELIKTNNKGEIIEATDNPYTFFSILNGDTLVSNRTSVINKTTGESIFQYRYCYNIAASSSGIYVYLWDEKRGVRHIKNIVNNTTILEVSDINGLYSNGNVFYIIEDTNGNDGIGVLTYIDEKLRIKKQALIPILGPRGIAEFEGSIYVFSDVDKSFYRIEPSESTNDFIYPLRMDYDVVPNKLFVECSSDYSQEYIIALLQEQFDNNFKVFRWRGSYNQGIICEIIVDDDMIDNAIPKLLKDESVLVARRSYIDPRDYQRFLKEGSQGYLASWELYINNDILYETKSFYNQDDLDSLANAHNLTITPNNYNPEKEGIFHAPKTTDIFTLAKELYDSGFFTRIQLNVEKGGYIAPSTFVENANNNQAKVIKEVYYNVLGEIVDSPSGITIVVTYYNDGYIRTEKKKIR